MFSIMTIASSTTKPDAIVIAISDRLLRLNPARYITPNVPTSDSGTDRLGMIVPRTLPRNRKITSTTSTTASASSNWTELTEARIVSVRSLSTVRSTAAGSAARSRGNKRLDAVDNLDDIGARLALHVNDDRRLVFIQPAELGVLGALDRLRDIGQAHRRAVAVGDTRSIVIGGAFQLVVGIDRIGQARPVEIAFRRVDVGVADRRAQIVDIEAVGGELAQIGLDAQRRAVAAADR